MEQAVFYLAIVCVLLLLSLIGVSGIFLFTINKLTNKLMARNFHEYIQTQAQAKAIENASLVPQEIKIPNEGEIQDLEELNAMARGMLL